MDLFKIDKDLSQSYDNIEDLFLFTMLKDAEIQMTNTKLKDFIDDYSYYYNLKKGKVIFPSDAH